MDIETKRKLRAKNASNLLAALEAQDEFLSMGLAFEERVRLLVDDTYSAFTYSKITGLLRRAGLRYLSADLRPVDLLEECGLDRAALTQLGSCSFVDRRQKVVFQGFTGSGKSYLGGALVKEECQHRIRAHYIRMPDLGEAWSQAS